MDWTVDLSFPDSTAFAFATSELTLVKGTYINDLEEVGEIRQSLEAATDRVSVALQNKSRTIGQHVAENIELWQKAGAIIGRYYRGGANFATNTWVEMFRGIVQQPQTNDFQVSFDVVSDVSSAGLIVCNRTLHPNCWYRFKDPTTCGYSGGEALCNHHLKSLGGCDGRNNAHRYGGMEHRYNPDLNPPGSGGNPGEIIIPGPGPCARVDQWTIVRGPDGSKARKRVGQLTTADLLYNPISRRFHEISALEIVKNVPIWEAAASNGSNGFSSPSHPILWDREHKTGEPVGRFRTGDPILTWRQAQQMVSHRCLLAQFTGETGDVVRITMRDGKIYCYSNDGVKFIVCHNSKPPILE